MNLSKRLRAMKAGYVSEAAAANKTNFQKYSLLLEGALIWMYEEEQIIDYVGDADEPIEDKNGEAYFAVAIMSEDYENNATIEFITKGNTLLYGIDTAPNKKVPGFVLSEQQLPITNGLIAFIKKQREKL